MSEHGGDAVRERDLDRFLTLVDAIVAIAITLLVLPLVDGAADVGKHSAWTLIQHDRAPIGAFFLSFIVIANLWLIQHRILRHVVATNDMLTRLLLMWTVTIVFLPFPTALVSSTAGQDAVTKVLYIGSMGFSSLVLGLVCLVVAKDPTLRDDVPPPDAKASFLAAATFAVALAITLVFPATSYWPLLLLVVRGQVAALGDRLSARRGGVR